MQPLHFSTRDLPVGDQRAAWSEWFQPVFDVSPEDTGQAGFIAEYAVWKLGSVNMTWANGPAARTVRGPSHLRHSADDHWVITYCKDGPTTLCTRNGDLDAGAGIPFVWSLGHVSSSRRTMADRLQLYLPRDAFFDLGESLDRVTGSALDTPAGHMLADYMVMLHRNLASLTPEDGARLSQAIRAMVAACVSPSTDRLAEAEPQLEVTLMERVRRAIRRNLSSPSLGPDTLCRDAAMSRSKLYRILEGEGGVAHYIQRCRLSEGFAILSDVSNKTVIGQLAEDLCFADASSFSRAFRREFGMSPSDVRADALAGRRPVASARPAAAAVGRRFSECLRA